MSQQNLKYYISTKTCFQQKELTVHAIAVSTATSMWPLYIRSLQPPLALFNKRYHEDLSPTLGLKMFARKLTFPQSGINSAGYSLTSAINLISRKTKTKTQLVPIFGNCRTKI
jgi:hypothetical protein